MYSAQGYQQVAAAEQHYDPDDGYEQQQQQQPHASYDLYDERQFHATTTTNHNDIDDGDLGVSAGIPPPHMLPGSSYPSPPRSQPARPPSASSSSGGARSHASRSQQSHRHHHQQQRTFSLPPPAGAAAGGPGVGTYRFAPSESSSAARRGGRHSLPPPQSYQYARAQAPNEVGYSHSHFTQQQHHQQQLNDPYSMPNYLYAPSPRSGGAPSVSSGASGSTRNDGIFAVAAPHHSLGQQQRNRYGAGPQNTYSAPGTPAGYSNSGNGTGGGGGGGMAVGDVLPPFPPWSMAWYAGHMSADGHAYTMIPPQGSGAGDWESDTLTSTGYGGGPGGGAYPHFRPYPHGSYPYPYGTGGSGTGTPVEDDPEARAAARKAARLRALEREFGLKVDGRDPHAAGGADEDEDGDDAALLEKGGGRFGAGLGAEEDEDENLPPGSITSQGRFVHRHPKMRSAVGIALLLLCVLAFAIGAAGSYMIKLGPNVLPTSAPAKGTIGSYLLYVLSFLCLAISFYLFLIRPCCVDPMRRRRINNAALANGPAGLAGGAGIVVPVLAGGGPGDRGKPPKMPRGAGRRGGRRGLFGRKGGEMPAPTVNLIVDPRAMLGAGGLDDDDDSSDDEDERGGAARLEKDALAGPENSDLAGLIGGRLGAGAVGGADGTGAGAGGALTKKQRKRQRRAARLRALNAASRIALFQPFVLAALKTQAVWLCVQSLLWLLAVVACLVPLFRSTSAVNLTFTDAGTNETTTRSMNLTRTALGAACPPRGGGGWCDAYNGARASAVIAMVVCMGLAAWAVQELGQAKKMARREGAGFRVR
ncbi:hypothetical protein OC835_003233 [Tilletia horrida]|nr:hypothetical protein OC835_003233 [Tilletia horrida]